MPETERLPLQDGDYWDAPQTGMAGIVRAMKRRPPGFWIGVPAEVALARRSTLPVVGYFRCSIADQKTNRLERTTLLVAVRLESNEVWAAEAFYPKDRPPPDTGSGKGDGGGDGAPALEIQGTYTETFALDAHDRIPALPWRAGSFALAVVSFDQLSNLVQARLVEEESKDPAVREFLEKSRRPAYPKPVWPRLPRPSPAGSSPAGPASLPIYRPTSTSPPAPATAGIRLAMERVVVLGERPRLVVEGSFALPLLARERVRPMPFADAPPERRAELVRGSGWEDVGDPQAKAVVPITLLLTGAESPAPVLHRLQVPVYGSLPPEGDPATLAVGHFRVDLFSLADLTYSPQTYSVYAISGAVVSGPFPVALIVPGMLPKPGE